MLKFLHDTLFNAIVGIIATVALCATVTEIAMPVAAMMRYENLYGALMVIEWYLYLHFWNIAVILCFMMMADDFGFPNIKTFILWLINIEE